MRHTVLVVDDEEDVRELARLSLERVGGMTVLTASSAREAVEVMERSDHIDVVLLDVMMPGTDGPAALRALRSSRGGAQVPVVFFTASVQDDQVTTLSRLDVSGVLAKPFDPLVLPQQLRQVARLPGGES